MIILVLSDSHASMRFMRRCVQSIHPDAVIHLGDYYDDGQALQEEFPGIPFHLVPGNCDKYRCPPDTPQSLGYAVCGMRMLMTHGHMFYVKSGTGALTAQARRMGVQAALYGHTHQAQCTREEDGLWVINPGSAAYSAAVIQTDGEKITACRVITEADLEEIL